MSDKPPTPLDYESPLKREAGGIPLFYRILIYAAIIAMIIYVLLPPLARARG